MAEDGIKHTTIKVNGINMHIAEKGEGPVVLFVHGFPELWYSWRHQILALSALGYRAVALDMRGYGDSDSPADSSKYTYFHTAGDLVGLIDALGEDKVFVVGHDWGAMVAWYLCLLRPDRVRALVNTSVVFGVFGEWSLNRWPIDDLRTLYGEDYYMIRFQSTPTAAVTLMVPGEMELEIAEAGGAEKLLKKLFSLRSPDPLLLPKDIPPRPTWMSEEELAYYVSKFEQKGFTGGLNYYRAIDLSWELIGAWKGAKVMVPTKFIAGELDLSFHMAGVQDYVNKGGMLNDVPLLKEVVVLEGVGHFLNQEKPHEISNTSTTSSDNSEKFNPWISNVLLTCLCAMIMVDVVKT